MRLSTILWKLLLRAAVAAIAVAVTVLDQTSGTRLLDEQAHGAAIEEMRSTTADRVGASTVRAAGSSSRPRADRRNGGSIRARRAGSR